ncbi:MAG: DNA processing protein DprA, partial [Oscillatoriales cyanobacterium SM2_1_8]|nr:DNA processing protein DprA [Oscillatoriales cyanobacterium SM2_1_8]
MAEGVPVDKGYERAYWLAWSQVPGIGPVLLSRLRTTFPSLETAWRASARELQKVEGLGAKTAEEVVAHRRAVHPQRLWEEHWQQNGPFWLPLDPEYPHLLQEIPDAPSVLYVAGPWRQWDETKTVAIVGTREPTVYGRRWAANWRRAWGGPGLRWFRGWPRGS